MVAGPAKKTHILTEAERWRIAIHEAGHAVAHAGDRAGGERPRSSPSSPVDANSAPPQMLTDRDAVMHARGDLERHLAAILAGTAAELIEFSEPSTGSSEDLHAATELARRW